MTNILLLVACTSALYSCLTIRETIRLKEDGSGTVTTEIDLSQAEQLRLVRSVLANSLQVEPTALHLYDTSFSLLEQAGAVNPHWTTEDKLLMGRIQTRINLDFDHGRGGLRVHYPFASDVELSRLMLLIDGAKIDSSRQTFQRAAPGDGMVTILNYQPGRLQRTSQFSSPIDYLQAYSYQTRDRLEALYGDARLEYILELPGEVYHTEGFPHARIDSNRLLLEFSLMDRLERRDSIDEALDGRVWWANAQNKD